MENNITNIDHIGLVVYNIEEHIPYYRDILKLPFKGIKTHTEEGIKTAIFQVGESNTFLEVFQPLDEKSSIYAYLQKKGEGFHHLCFGVKDITEALDHAQKNNVELINKEPFIGVQGHKVAFLHPKSTKKLLTEFAELK